jgi:hypothetical protein
MNKRALLRLPVVAVLLLSSTVGAIAEATPSHPKVHRVRLQATPTRQAWSSPQTFSKQQVLMFVIRSEGRELNHWTKPSECRARLRAQTLDLTASFCGRRLRVSYVGETAFTMLYWLRPSATNTMPERLR